MSNLIKSSSYVSLEEIRLIEIIQRERRTVRKDQPAQEADKGEAAPAHDELDKARQQVIREAEIAAEKIIMEAKAEAARISEQSTAEIQQWWETRRQEDAAAAQEARQLATDQGYQDGLAAAESAARTEYAEIVQEARNILQQAHQMKREIILEAEPFLVALSCAIAEKIIGRELSDSVDWVKQTIRSLLDEQRDKKTIVLAVSPEQFTQLVKVKEEFALVVGSQAELRIVPDARVQNHGVIISTPFGSIDARIETQLEEIRQALVSAAEELALLPESGGQQ